MLKLMPFHIIYLFEGLIKDIAMEQLFHLYLGDNRLFQKQTSSPIFFKTNFIQFSYVYNVMSRSKPFFCQCRSVKQTFLLLKSPLHRNQIALHV